MAIDLLRMYEEIAEASRTVRGQSLSDLPPIEAAHSAINEVQIWQGILQDRPESVVFGQIVSGLELGLFALVSGLYRQAYGSLRLGVELIAALSWFSTKRLDLAEWQSGERDLIWRDITNPDDGILSPRYRKAFFPELDEEKRYNSVFRKLYRELSEHVHGNAKTWGAPDDIKFDKRLQDDWLAKLETFILVMHVLLSLRYLQEIASNHISSLDPILRRRIPQVAAITKYLDDRAASAAQVAPAVQSAQVAQVPPAVTTPDIGGSANTTANGTVGNAAQGSPIQEMLAKDRRNVDVQE